MIELNPKDWSSKTRPERPKYTLKIFLAALALSAAFNHRSLVNAVSSLYAPDHSVVPPGQYEWTPEHGLRPLTAGSPATQPRP